jgi:hypothetical protein
MERPLPSGLYLVQVEGEGWPPLRGKALLLR